MAKVIGTIGAQFSGRGSLMAEQLVMGLFSKEKKAFEKIFPVRL